MGEPDPSRISVGFAPDPAEDLGGVEAGHGLWRGEMAVVAENLDRYVSVPALVSADAETT